jgi:hypothetical protein
MFTKSTIARRAALTLAVLGAAALAPSALAADTATDKMPGSYSALMKMKPMAIMHMMDVGKKGYVTKEEFMKFHEAMFDKMDKNKDGKLSEDEFVARTHTGP